MDEHGTGMPVATMACNEKGGEPAAVRALLEEVPLRGRMITVDALHTTRDMARLIVETHGADYLFTVKGNSPETFETLGSIDWDRDADGTYQEPFDKAHGRIESRRIQVLKPLEGMINYPHVAQAFRFERLRHNVRTGLESDKIGYAITSDANASPQQLLEWNRGHWAVENLNHWIRDTHLREDKSLVRTGHGPANRAICRNIALAVPIGRGHGKISDIQFECLLDRQKALDMALDAR